MKTIALVHPGEILREEFLRPLGLSQYRLAKDIGVPPIRISEIVRGKRSLSADTALRLGKYFNNTPEFWMNLQNHFDIEYCKSVLGDVLENQVKVFSFEVKKRSPIHT